MAVAAEGQDLVLIPILEDNMRPDGEIKKDVEDELRWDPDIDATDVGVVVRNGVVTLTGYVRSYMQKTQAERDALGVMGTAGIANDIEVRLPYTNAPPDPEIARDALEKLRDELPYSSQFIKVTVKDGRLTLAGALEWNYQRDRADEAVRSVRGVIDITDNLTLRPRVTVRDAKRQMRDAMKRSANSTRTALRSRLSAPK
jgi:osmotically-inducible protein OsmY